MICSKCKSEERVSGHSWCRTCRKIARRKHYLETRNTSLEERDRLKSLGLKECSSCAGIFRMSEFPGNGPSVGGIYSMCGHCKRKKQKLWGEKNRERKYEHHKRWRKNNPKTFRDNALRSASRRRARKLDAYIEDVDRNVIYERDNGVCGICNKAVPRDDFHVDHIIPLSRGGEHSYDNCQLSHSSCNRRKGDQIFE